MEPDFKTEEELLSDRLRKEFEESPFTVGPPYGKPIPEGVLILGLTYHGPLYVKLEEGDSIPEFVIHDTEGWGTWCPVTLRESENGLWYEKYSVGWTDMPEEISPDCAEYLKECLEIVIPYINKLNEAHKQSLLGVQEGQ